MSIAIKRRILAFSLPVLIGGCGLMGPTYKEPVIDTPDQWQSLPANAQVESGVNLSDRSWWTKFDDPILDDLIEQALANNNNIQIAIGNITVAEAQLKRVQMNWVPTVNLGGTAGVGQTFNFSPGMSNPSAFPLAGSSSSNFNFYGAGLLPSYSLNIFQQIKQQDVAQANLAASKYAKDATRLAVISQVAGSYFTLLAINDELTQQKQMVADLTEMTELTKIQYKHGYATLTDVQQYEEQLMQAKMQLPTLQSNKVATTNALQVLLNKNPGPLMTDSTFEDITTEHIIPNSLPSSVLRNRPDIMQAEAQLKMANADIGVATSNFFPSLNITTPVGLFNSNYANLFNPSGDFWVAQITAVMPILNLGLYSLIKEKKGQYYVAYYSYIQTVRSAFAEVDDNFSNYDQITIASGYANKLYTLTKSNNDLAKKNFKLGYSAYSDTISSRVAADNAKMNVTQMKLKQLQALINLYQSLAGGYNYKNTSKPNKFGDSHDS